MLDCLLRRIWRFWWCEDDDDDGGGGVVAASASQILNGEYYVLCMLYEISYERVTLMR